MKIKVLILAILFSICAFNASAADRIWATVVITNASHFNEATPASITISSDTRIWTNSVTTPSTEIRSSTNIANAAFYLLQQVRSYPFTDIQLQATNSGIVLIGDAPLTITLSNTWGTVAYRTNTIAESYAVVRLPRTIESAETQAQVSDGLVDYLNQAPTNSISESSTAAANLAGLTKAQTITGANTISNSANIFYGKTFQMTHSALTADSAVTNFVADFGGDGYRTITAAAAVNFLQSTNRSAVRSIVIFVDANGADRTLTVNSSWKKLNSFHTIVTNGTIGVISLTTKGTAETDVFAAYTVTQ